MTGSGYPRRQDRPGEPDVGAVQRGQLDAAFEIFDPEVEVYSSPELANPRTFRGVEDLVRWITTWNEAWESFRLDAVETVPIGEHHAVTRMHPNFDEALAVAREREGIEEG